MNLPVGTVFLQGYEPVRADDRVCCSLVRVAALA